MATVPDLSGNVTEVDPPLTKHNRENAGDPNGSLTPEFSGEIIFDTTNQVRWQAGSVANDNWYQIDPGPGTIS